MIMPSTNRGFFRFLVPGVAVLEDFFDRLNHAWTSGLLVIMAALIGWRQQDSNRPIVCSLPAEFDIQHIAYAHAKCWTSDQYYKLPKYEDLYNNRSRTDDLVTTGWLHKWLPIILFIQALLFKFPSIIMNALHGFSGISFDKIAGLTKGYSQLHLEERSVLGRSIGRYVYNWCVQCEKCLPWRFLTMNWLLVKVMYVVNVIVQLSLVDKLIGPSTPPLDVNSTTRTSYGDVLYDNFFNANSTEWKSPSVFPRTIMCEYFVRQLRNIQQYIHQCDMPINEFNEHVFMVLWLWLYMVSIFSCLSLIVWILFTLVPVSRQRYVTRLLTLSEDLNVHSSSASINQLASTLGEDGVFVLKLIASNSSELLVKDAVMTMYELKNTQYPSRYTPHPEVAQYPVASAPVHGQTSSMTSDQPPQYQTKIDE